MMKTWIFVALVSAASARQFPESEVHVVHPDVEEEPSKFAGLIPDWETPLMLNYSEMFDSVNEKLAALDKINVSPGFAGNGTFSVGAALAPVSTFITWSGDLLTSTASAAFSIASTLGYPLMVTIIFYSGVFSLIQLGLQVNLQNCSTSDDDELERVILRTILPEIHFHQQLISL